VWVVHRVILGGPILQMIVGCSLLAAAFLVSCLKLRMYTHSKHKCVCCIMSYLVRQSAGRDCTTGKQVEL
jgi:hypothetical protein